MVATAVCSWWTIYLGFADVVTTTADGYHDKHRTFDKVPTDDRP